MKKKYLILGLIFTITNLLKAENCNIVTKCHDKQTGKWRMVTAEDKPVPMEAHEERPEERKPQCKCNE